MEHEKYKKLTDKQKFEYMELSQNSCMPQFFLMLLGVCIFLIGMFHLGRNTIDPLRTGFYLGVGGILFIVTYIGLKEPLKQLRKIEEE